MRKVFEGIMATTAFISFLCLVCGQGIPMVLCLVFIGVLNFIWEEILT